MNRVLAIKKLLLAVCIIGFSGITLAEKVIYPNIDGIGRESIGYSVLKLALEKSEPNIDVYLDKQEVNQTRAKYMVEIGQADVFDSGFQPQLEARFKPIYLPIDRGILGWRLFIIHKDNASALGKVQNIEDLKRFLFGQGSGWGDIDILEKAGLKVITSRAC